METLTLIGTAWAIYFFWMIIRFIEHGFEKEANMKLEANKKRIEQIFHELGISNYKFTSTACWFGYEDQVIKISTLNAWNKEDIVAIIKKEVK